MPEISEEDLVTFYHLLLTRNFNRNRPNLTTFLLKIYWYVLCVCVCAWVYVYEPPVCRSHRSQKRVLESMDLRLQNSLSTTHGCWDLNPGPQHKQQELLDAQPSLQHQKLTTLWAPPVSNHNCFDFKRAMSHYTHSIVIIFNDFVVI